MTAAIALAIQTLTMQGQQYLVQWRGLALADCGEGAAWIKFCTIGARGDVCTTTATAPKGRASGVGGGGAAASCGDSCTTNVPLGSSIS